MAKKAPGKAHRNGITLIEIFELFPDEEAATKWFEGQVWPVGRCCPHCGSVRTSKVPNAKPMPYWCSDCRSYFSVRTGTAVEHSRVPLRKWAIAIYLCATGIKGVSSMKLHRDIGVTQRTAWFMLHRLRKAWEEEKPDMPYNGPVEVDEAYFGGKRHNMSNAKRKALAEAGTGPGPVGKTAVVGAKDRATNQVTAEVVESTDKETLHEFVDKSAEPWATVYTDDARAYDSLLFEHESVKHSQSEYVRGEVHTNGIESFWSLFKRGFHGTYHRMSPKHLHRYVDEFTGRHNIRDKDTIDQMRDWVAALIGKRLLYRDLVS